MLSSTNFGAGGVLPASLDKPILESLAKCGTKAIVTRCTNDEGQHYWAKRLYCGQEWCPVCGEKGSHTHLRRVSKWVPKARQLENMGYLVIEWPVRYRKVGRVAEYEGDTRADPGDGQGHVYSHDALRATTNAIIEVLAGKRKGRKGRVDGFFGRGVLRWHWYGDDDPQGRGYNPHVNVLVDAGRLSKQRLNALKQALRDSLRVPDLIVHYHYTTKPAQMMFWLRYVTRATFRDYTWDGYMARQLYNFRNSRWWGNWKGEPVWGVTPDIDAEAGLLEKLLSIGSGKCPVCHCQLEKWSKAFDSRHLDAWGAVEFGGGYYSIPQREFEPDTFSPDMAIRLSEMERETQERRKHSIFGQAVASRLTSEGPGKEGWFTRHDLRILWRDGHFTPYGEENHGAG